MTLLGANEVLGRGRFKSRELHDHGRHEEVATRRDGHDKIPQSLEEGYSSLILGPTPHPRSPIQQGSSVALGMLTPRTSKAILADRAPLADVVPRQTLCGHRCNSDDTGDSNDTRSFSGMNPMVPSMLLNANIAAQVKAHTFPRDGVSTRQAVRPRTVCLRSLNRSYNNPLNKVRIEGLKNTTRRHRSLPAQAPDPTPPPQMQATRVPSLREFRFVKHLGSGHFGDVYLAYHKLSKVQVALKIVSKSSPTSCDQRGRRLRRKAGYQTLQRCGGAIEEYFALRRLTGVPGIAELLATFHDMNFFYIAMRYYPGGDLQSRLDQGGFHHSHAQFYIAELVSALAYLTPQELTLEKLLGVEELHRRRIVHRDLKPSNIMIDAEGHLVICDFGLARCFRKDANPFEREAGRICAGPDAIPDIPGTKEEITASSCGTAEYIAPEVYRGDLYSYPVDIWAVGMIAYRMLLNRFPWNPPTDQCSISDLVLNIRVSFEPWEHSMYSLSEDTDFFLRQVCTTSRVGFGGVGSYGSKALSQDPDVRPTATRLKSHLFFRKFDWAGLIDRSMIPPWVPKHHQIAASPGRSVVIPHEKSYSLKDDPIPFFSFISPSLLPVPN